MASYKITPLLSVSIKYSVLRGGTFYYYRKVPVAFQADEGTFIRQSTGTSDPLKAALIIKALNNEAEARWKGKAVTQANETQQAKGIRLLAQYGLTYGLYSGGATLEVKREALERVGYPFAPPSRG